MHYGISLSLSINKAHKHKENKIIDRSISCRPICISVYLRPQDLLERALLQN